MYNLLQSLHQAGTFRDVGIPDDANVWTDFQLIVESVETTDGETADGDAVGEATTGSSEFFVFSSFWWVGYN